MLCAKCNSTWRIRATALGVLVGTGMPQAPFPEVNPNWFWRGVGTSDHMALAGALASRFDHTNSYYHRFPRLDLLNVSEEQRRQFGFVICSDVLEHAILSVPCGGRAVPTDEYYPDLASWTEFEDRVEWVDTNGNQHTDFEPEFHGGGGQTLAFRLWGMEDFCSRLIASGFNAVSEIPTNPELGVPEIEGSGMFIAHINR